MSEKFSTLKQILMKEYDLIEVSICEKTNSVYGINQCLRGYKIGDLSYLLHVYKVI